MDTEKNSAVPALRAFAQLFIKQYQSGNST